MNVDDFSNYNHYIDWNLFYIHAKIDKYPLKTDGDKGTESRKCSRQASFVNKS